MFIRMFFHENKHLAASQADVHLTGQAYHVKELIECPVTVDVKREAHLPRFVTAE